MQEPLLELERGMSRREGLNVDSLKMDIKMLLTARCERSNSQNTFRLFSVQSSCFLSPSPSPALYLQLRHLSPQHRAPYPNPLPTVSHNAYLRYPPPCPPLCTTHPSRRRPSEWECRDGKLRRRHQSHPQRFIRNQLPVRT